ncbi:MAG: L-seryl-tRNA(Sec) selenium transferase, partial [Planctomycetota bacterium]|nr:L-seryl-tRNA(Sec) selenium transferase [Planctomycetota bacterium]
LLKVHPSNYRIDGFHGEVGLAELVKIGTRNHLPVIEDLGSGLMLEEKLPHDARESNVPASVRTGADLVCFSGDKLFGSCQAGILVGKRAAIARVAGHPLYRALRVDKLALAALEATLLTYRFGEPKRDIPILRAIWAPLEEIEAEATALQAEIGEPARLLGYLASVEESLGYVGSGASPARSLQSRAVRLAPDAPRLGIEEFARRLRCAEPAVFPRIEDGSLFLDLRSLAPGQWREIVEVVAALSREEG